MLEKALGGDSFDTFLLTAVAGALFVTGIAVLVRALFMSSGGERVTVEQFDTRHKVAAIPVGISVGFVLGLTSASAPARRSPSR